MAAAGLNLEREVKYPPKKVLSIKSKVLSILRLFLILWT